MASFVTPGLTMQHLAGAKIVEVGDVPEDRALELHITVRFVRAHNHLNAFILFALQ